MKKSLLGLLLAVVLVVPAFAVDKGSMEFDAKLGVSIEPILLVSRDNGYKYSYPAYPAFSLGADFYYYAIKNLGIGVGVNHIFKSKMNENWGRAGCKLGATNIYATVKPVFELNDSYIDKIYFLGQLGYGIFNNEKLADSYPSEEADNGLYWAIGVGVEKYNVILELVYSVNYSYFDCWKYGMTYRNLAVNVGYKFSI